MQPWPFKSMGLFCLSGNTAKLPTKKPVPGQWYFCQTSSGKQDVVLRCRGYTVLCNSLTWEISVGFWHFGVSWSWYFMFTFFLHPSSPVWLQRPIPLGQATGPFCFVGSFLISSALRWTPRAAGMTCGTSSRCLRHGLNHETLIRPGEILIALFHRCYKEFSRR